MLTFSSPPTTTTCSTRRKASASSESQPSSSEEETQLTHFFQISKILYPRFRCMTSFTQPDPFPIWNFYFDISEWNILPARAWTPALMLNLTNPCAKLKVLSLTKPKGKICIKWYCTYTKLFWHLTGVLKKSILILNWISWIRTVWIDWIAWNRNVLTIKLCTYAKLNCFKWNYLHKNGFGVK